MNTDTTTQEKKRKKGRRSARKPGPEVVYHAVELKPEIGRPTIYTDELATRICERIAGGESLLQICRDEDMPGRSTVHEWLLDDDKKTFADKYARARDLQAEFLVDETLEIADDATNDIIGDDKSDNARVNARRLQIDARKWYASKVLPKKYGDKVDLTSGDKPLQQPPNTIVFVPFSKQDNAAGQ